MIMVRLCLYFLVLALGCLEIKQTFKFLFVEGRLNVKYVLDSLNPDMHGCLEMRALGSSFGGFAGLLGLDWGPN
jgi:hypothetical protein